MQYITLALKRIIDDYKETVGNCDWCKFNKLCEEADDDFCEYTRKWYLFWRPK